MSSKANVSVTEYKNIKKIASKQGKKMPTANAVSKMSESKWATFRKNIVDPFLEQSKKLIKFITDNEDNVKDSLGESEFNGIRKRNFMTLEDMLEEEAILSSKNVDYLSRLRKKLHDKGLYSDLERAEKEKEIRQKLKEKGLTAPRQLKKLEDTEMTNLWNMVKGGIESRLAYTSTFKTKLKETVEQINKQLPSESNTIQRAKQYTKKDILEMMQQEAEVDITEIPINKLEKLANDFLLEDAIDREKEDAYDAVTDAIPKQIKFTKQDIKKYLEDKVYPLVQIKQKEVPDRSSRIKKMMSIGRKVAEEKGYAVKRVPLVEKGTPPLGKATIEEIVDEKRIPIDKGLFYKKPSFTFPDNINVGQTYEMIKTGEALKQEDISNTYTRFKKTEPYRPLRDIMETKKRSNIVAGQTKALKAGEDDLIPYEEFDFWEKMDYNRKYGQWKDKQEEERVDSNLQIMMNGVKNIGTTMATKMALTKLLGPKLAIPLMVARPTIQKLIKNNADEITSVWSTIENHLGIPKEKHLLPSASGDRYNFCGPGTNIDKLFTVRGLPVDMLDYICFKHDMYYQLNNKEVRMTADDVMMHELEILYDSVSDWNQKLAITAVWYIMDNFAIGKLQESKGDPVTEQDLVDLYDVIDIYDMWLRDKGVNYDNYYLDWEPTNPKNVEMWIQHLEDTGANNEELQRIRKLPQEDDIGSWSDESVVREILKDLKNVDRSKLEDYSPTPNDIKFIEVDGITIMDDRGNYTRDENNNLVPLVKKGTPPLGKATVEEIADEIMAPPKGIMAEVGSSNAIQQEQKIPLAQQDMVPLVKEGTPPLGKATVEEIVDDDEELNIYDEQKHDHKGDLFDMANKLLKDERKPELKPEGDDYTTPQADTTQRNDDKEQYPERTMTQEEFIKNVLEKKDGDVETQMTGTGTQTASTQTDKTTQKVTEKKTIIKYAPLIKVLGNIEVNELQKDNIDSDLLFEEFTLKNTHWTDRNNSMFRETIRNDKIRGIRGALPTSMDIGSDTLFRQKFGKASVSDVDIQNEIMKHRIKRRVKQNPMGIEFHALPDTTTFKVSRDTINQYQTTQWTPRVEHEQFQNKQNPTSLDKEEYYNNIYSQLKTSDYKLF